MERSAWGCVVKSRQMVLGGLGFVSSPRAWMEGIVFEVFEIYNYFNPGVPAWLDQNSYKVGSEQN